MRKVKLGSTDLEVSAIAYGGMSLTPERAKEGAAAVAVAFELGINFYDTADVYGGGEAERSSARRLVEAGCTPSSITRHCEGYLRSSSFRVCTIRSPVIAVASRR